ncbi:phosphotransferase [Saccharopolyspora erythraea]|uniref:phosphotransferase n=1 Tax=Saccharopolyspora erythraea TaxID=1836 RepID=UPI001BA9C405|nr:phosphotransferase [Saccharopolyspora erythraea]QUH05547.1 phosphotransferase [Saccharopolyspora erythraea]
MADHGERRAVRAAVAAAAAHGVRVSEPVVLAAGYNVVVRLDPAPVVARVVLVPAVLRSDVDGLVAREISVASFLAGRGVPAVRPSAVLPPGPHHHDGLRVSFWEPLPAISEGLPGAAEFGTRLRELHEVLREHPAPAPVLDVPIGDVEAFLRSPFATRDDLAMARTLERIVPEVTAVRPVQRVHGDAHPRNLVRAGGTWTWTDFEECCTAPVEWDLAVMRGTDRLDGAEALRAYGGDDGVLEPFRLLRELQASAWVRTRAAVGGA